MSCYGHLREGMSKMEPRKILVISADRAERGLLEPVMVELKKLEGVEAKWFFFDAEVGMVNCLRGAAHYFALYQPDIIVVPADRYEMVYIAALAFHSGYIVAHFHAGNNETRTPDDLNRRAISCFSHIMFCNMPEHKQNLVRQGEEPWRIHVVGSTAFDHIVLDDSVTPKEPFDLVILHPNPLSIDETKQDLVDTLAEICNTEHVIWIYPNHDKHHEIIESRLDKETGITRFKNLPRGQYFSLLKNCSRAVGNSSSFHYEGPILNPQFILVQVGERNKGLKVPKTVTGGSARIAEILATITIDDRLRRKRLTV